MQIKEPANDPRFWYDVGPLVAFDYDQSRRVQLERQRARKTESIGGVFILACVGIVTGVIVGSSL